MPIIALLAVSAGSVGVAVAAQPPVGLGTAASFAVLGGSAVTNTGPSVINGDLGVSPGTAISGFPPGTVNGTTHSADAVAAQAQADQTTAYNDAAGRTPVVDVSGDLGGQTLTAGVYKSASSIGLTGSLTLNAQGDPNAVFIFQIGSTLTTATASQINLINGAQACNVYWQVGSSATLGSASVFVGNLLAYTSISMDNDVTVAGRALAQNGAVTLIDDSITPTGCATSSDSTGSAAVTAAPATTTAGAATPSATKPAVTTPAASAVTKGTANVGTGTKASSTKGTGTKSTSTKGTGTKSTVSKGGGTKGTSTTGAGNTGAGVPMHRNGTAVLAPKSAAVTRALKRLGSAGCVSGRFLVAVSGRNIRSVVFSLAGQRVMTRARSPFTALISAPNGVRTVTARVRFTDQTHAVTRQLRFRECTAVAAKVTSPSAKPIGTTGFTG